MAVHVGSVHVFRRMMAPAGSLIKLAGIVLEIICVAGETKSIFNPSFNIKLRLLVVLEHTCERLNCSAV